MRRMLVILSIAVVSSCSSKAPQTSHDKNWALCGAQYPDIRSCTAIIESGEEPTKKLALAFYFRAAGYSGNLRDEDRALLDLDDAIRLDPNNAPFFNDRGATHINRHEYDLAIQDFDRSIELDSSDALTFNNRGTAYNNKGDYDLAIQDFDRAIRMDGKLIFAWANRGSAYNGKKEYNRALREFDQAIRLLQGDAVPYLTAGTFAGRGFAYLKLGQLDMAIAAYDAALKVESTHAAALYGRGLAKQAKGDAAGGSADIAAAEVSDPEITARFERAGM